MKRETSLLGRNLHILLYDRQKTKRELAEEIHASPQMISAIIYGRKMPSVSMLVKIAGALGVTVDELLRERDVR